MNGPGNGPGGPLGPTPTLPSESDFYAAAGELASAAASAAAVKFNITAMANMESHGCPLPTPIYPIYTVPLTGSLNFYQLNVIVSAACTAFSGFVMLVLMWQHWMNVTKPQEQIHILRICAFIPLYGFGTIFQIVYPNTYVWLNPWLKVLEGFAIAYFYLLMCWLLLPEMDNMSVHDANMDDVYLSLQTHPQIRDGKPITHKLFTFKRQYWLVFQCPVVQLGVAICTDITMATGDFCLISKDTNDAHLWLEIIQILSVIFAVVGVIRAYMPNKKELSPHKTMTKLWAFKLIIGLQVLQNIIYLILESLSPSPLMPSIRLSAIDIVIGIPNMIVALELVFFAVFFHYAYSAVPYLPDTDVQVIRTGEPKVVQMSGMKLAWEFFNQTELIGGILFMFKIGKHARMLQSDRERGGRGVSNDKATSAHSSPAVGGIRE